jgi:hypothetical protein
MWDPINPSDPVTSAIFFIGFFKLLISVRYGTKLKSGSQQPHCCIGASSCYFLVQIAKLRVGPSHSMHVFRLANGHRSDVPNSRHLIIAVVNRKRHHSGRVVNWWVNSTTVDSSVGS